MSLERYEAFPSLAFDQPDDGILRITLDAPGLNAVSAAMHRELADVTVTTVNQDGDAVLTGAATVKL